MHQHDNYVVYDIEPADITCGRGEHEVSEALSTVLLMYTVMTLQGC